MKPPDDGSPGDDDPVSDADAREEVGADDADRPPAAADPAVDADDASADADDAGGNADADDADENADANPGDANPGPPAKRADGTSDDGPEEMELGEFINWLRTTDHGGVSAVREMLSTAAVVLLVGALLFGVSGVWPPMVAIESGSMTPHMQVGDLVFVMDEQRLKPAASHGDTGVVTYQRGEAVGYRKFRSYGDVVVYRPDGSLTQTPIIHRARFWVAEGENWYETKANPEYVNPNYRSCEQLPSCPAPHAGFVTKGDDNRYYDQAIGMSGPVRPRWVTGTAEFRIPWLGCIRLGFPPGCLTPPRTIPGSWVVLGVLAILAFAASSIER